MTPPPLRVTALAASAQLGGTERVLLDFAARAFEHDVSLSVLTPRDGPLIEILNQIGVPAAVVPGPTAMLRGSQQASQLWSLLPALASLPRWARALHRHRFWADAHVIYSISFKSHAATLLHRDRPLVWHLHEFPPATTGGVWRALARRVPDGLIANSEAVGRAWAGRLNVVPNGVDLDRFRPRDRTFWIHDKLGIPRDQRLIGMPAVFARWKGHEAVIEAFRSLSAECPRVHLVFVGGSIYDTIAEREFGAQLEHLTGEYEVSHARKVHILPFQSKIELAYPEFDVVVHYSLRPEPFGRVILEAMACGVPVVAAAEGGPLEILGARTPDSRLPTPATAGWLVPPRSPFTLAGALRTALALPREDLVKIGRLGRTRAEDHFSARAFARGVAEVLTATGRKGRDDRRGTRDE